MIAGITHDVVTVVRVVHQHAPTLLRRHLVPVGSCLVLARRRLGAITVELSRCGPITVRTYHGDLSRWYVGWDVCEHSGERLAVIVLSRCFSRVFFAQIKF